MDRSVINDAIYSPLNMEVNPNLPRRSPKFGMLKISNPGRRTVGVTSLFGETGSNLTPAERGQTRPVYNTETKTFEEFTPNDNNFFTRVKNALSPDLNLVLATWDSDGVHDTEDGRQVKHSKGEFKYDETGSEYYETLGNRSTAGKQFLKVSDILTIDGTAANKFDIFDSDSKDKGVFK
ncbi:MAG: hypothetical protein Nk1A_7830 [Endomicrobiia bacterium]|nr:MAG: hypothetical protein Nk1A_7830 [Endomicrobiia bacterium]